MAPPNASNIFMTRSCQKISLCSPGSMSRRAMLGTPHSFHDDTHTQIRRATTHTPFVARGVTHPPCLTPVEKRAMAVRAKNMVSFDPDRSQAHRTRQEEPGKTQYLSCLLFIGRLRKNQE